MIKHGTSERRGEVEVKKMKRRGGGELKG